MSTRLFLVLTLIFALLQGPLLPSVFADGLLIVLLIFSRGLKGSLPFVFLAGVLFDLFQNRPLGASSLIFTTLAGASWYFRSHVSFENGLFLTGAVVLINFARSYFTFNEVLVLPMIFIAVVSLGIFNILQPIISSRRGYEV